MVSVCHGVIMYTRFVDNVIVYVPFLFLDRGREGCNYRIGLVSEMTLRDGVLRGRDDGIVAAFSKFSFARMIELLASINLTDHLIIDNRSEDASEFPLRHRAVDILIHQWLF